MRGQALGSYLIGITGLLGVSALFAAPAAPATSPPELPEGWREISEMVLAPGAGQVRVESRRGYGDPANGCFALVQRASGRNAKLDRARSAMAAGLKMRGLEVTGDGDEMTVRGLGIEGRIRTALRAESGGQFAAVSAACFYNGRQPDQCKVQCDALLDRLGGG